MSVSIISKSVTLPYPEGNCTAFGVQDNEHHAASFELLFHAGHHPPAKPQSPSALNFNRRKVSDSLLGVTLDERTRLRDCARSPPLLTKRRHDAFGRVVVRNSVRVVSIGPTLKKKAAFFIIEEDELREQSVHQAAHGQAPAPSLGFSSV